MNVNILGIDPGFASIGLAVVSIGATDSVVKALKLVKTEKASKKAGTYVSDDNVKRTQEITRALVSVLRDNDIKVICAEAMSFPRNSSAAAKMSLCWGALAATAEMLNIPIIQVSPQQAKVALCGRKDASKEDVQQALKDRFRVQNLDTLACDIPKSQREHPFDGLCAAVACNESQLIKMLRGTIQEPA